MMTMMMPLANRSQRHQQATRLLRPSVVRFLRYSWETSNPVRFGQEFQGRIANPRDVLIFHRAKRTARSDKVVIEKPELSIDDPDLSTAEKLSKVRVHTLVHEYLSAQELQLLGELGMSDAIELFVDKDDIHAISR